jgi:HTH-type transcriptional regulator/antitoxin HigA
MIRPVINDESHRAALRRIEELWNARSGSPEHQELDALATLVDAYEKRAYPVLPPSPIDAIRARCEQLGWSRHELEPLIGSRARVSEILSGKRSLTLSMIRNIHTAMRIPADVLISEARLAPVPRRSAMRRRRAGKPSKKEKTRSVPKRVL